MSEEELRGPSPPHRASDRRGRKNKAEEEAQMIFDSRRLSSHCASVRRGRKSRIEEQTRAFLESQGLPVIICEKCGHVAGTNEDCVCSL
jgi:hypothetical protein